MLKGGLITRGRRRKKKQRAKSTGMLLQNSVDRVIHTPPRREQHNQQLEDNRQRSAKYREKGGEVPNPTHSEGLPGWQHGSPFRQGPFRVFCILTDQTASYCYFFKRYSSWISCIGIPDSSLFVEYCRILGNFVHCKSTCASDFLCLFPSSWKRFSILVVLQNSTITWPNVCTGVLNG